MKSRNDPGPGTRVLSGRTWRCGTKLQSRSKYGCTSEVTSSIGAQFCGLPMTDSYRYKTTEEHAEIRRRGNGTPVVRVGSAARHGRSVARSEG